ncbi:hypothetical protein MRS76_24880 [Rhizobiaceae bacterium n13]|uniref:Uncharacterized protein n=1 Tax=Ferirhizobium litorale TaxID=2927786 RepID=A0AAE3QG31_9HYPH|nr:hypothetical protein [Fererhizobium litorale]MDI7865148.1 hypothetical protein [Fererhizobium litorale]MDI7922880.1 hypothetical protein [Fererhizobium litorale]
MPSTVATGNSPWCDDRIGAKPLMVPEVDPLSAIATLAIRIRAARILREHHVWEAVRLLPSLLSLTEDRDAMRRFRALMDTDLLSEAALFLIAASRPTRTVCRLALKDGVWVCTLRREERCSRDDARKFTTMHQDEAAALLSALIAADSRH